MKRPRRCSSNDWSAWRRGSNALLTERSCLVVSGTELSADAGGWSADAVGSPTNAHDHSPGSDVTASSNAGHHGLPGDAESPRIFIPGIIVTGACRIPGIRWAGAAAFFRGFATWVLAVGVFLAGALLLIPGLLFVPGMACIGIACCIVESCDIAPVLSRRIGITRIPGMSCVEALESCLVRDESIGIGVSRDGIAIAAIASPAMRVGRTRT